MIYGKILKALGHLTGAMVLISAGWTAVNVITLIGTSNPLGYGVAVMFDLAWLVAVAVQHEMRYRVDLRGRLSGIGWALTGLSAAINAWSELAGRHGVAVALVAAIVPALAKGSLALKLFTEQESREAKGRFTALSQSWQDRVTELRITEAMAGGWHRVERVHENADAARLAAAQRDRLSNLELTEGTEAPITRRAEPVVWEPPTYRPALAPVFREPDTAPSVVPVPFGFTTPGQPQVATPVHDAPDDARTAALKARTEALRTRRAEAIAAIETDGLTVEDAAARYDVTERTVRRWIRDATA
jgi:Homeodomain-like domain